MDQTGAVVDSGSVEYGLTAVELARFAAVREI